MTAALVALDLPGGAPFVEALQRAWANGDAVFPLDRRLPPAGRDRLFAAMAPTCMVDESGTHDLTGGRPVESGDALVVATSGSTGEPRGAVLTHAAVAASARATNARLDIGADDTWLACLPLSHVGGLAVVTRALHAGTALIVHDGFDADAVMASGATLVSLVSTALRRIDPTAFRTIVLGGSAPPRERPTNVVTTYGMTETGSGIVYDGRPLDGVEVRIDADGAIDVRGPMLLRAYRDGTVPLGDGWFATGDVGRWLPDGRLHVDGRRGDLIITGGENVWPGPVEAILRRQPGVADAAVAGVPDPEWGQQVTAFIVPGAPPPTLDQVRDAVKAELPACCAPRRIVFVAAIPRTSIGKVARLRLANLRDER
ncbi:MAG: AMP-binding protein [Actinomycetota bacterium]|nr:AMP-binding protein [Actinomycetota bacterium]